MAGNQVTLTFAGDAKSASAAIKRVDSDLSDAAGGAKRFEDGMDGVNDAVSTLSGGIGDIGGSMTAFTDLQALGAERAAEHEQALIDVETATTAYDDAVAEFGRDSVEARQAQLDLNNAMREAEPPSAMEEWGERLELLSPIISGVAGATDLMTLASKGATAAQWLWNAALTANPIGLTVVAITALVAIVVVIATKTTWFQDLWSAAWGGIKDAASSVGDWFSGTLWPKIRGVFDRMTSTFNAIPGKLKNAFSKVKNVLFTPFKEAFNAIARAWNSTIGALSWSVPGWVPGIGGNSISAPRLQVLHDGGVVQGAPGQDVLALLQAGETVTPAGEASRPLVLQTDGTRLVDLLLELLAEAIGDRGGDVQMVIGGRST